MAAHAGDTAQKTRIFTCATCGDTVRVQQGELIPPCRNGHTEFKNRMQQPRRR